MFHSRHPAAGMHAAARAVGGCSVYVSDAPGKHDPEILRKLVLPDGSVLRASLPGRPTADCIFADVARDGRTALKVWNRNAMAGVIGVFNLQGSWWDRELHQARIRFRFRFLSRGGFSPAPTLLHPLPLPRSSLASPTAHGSHPPPPSLTLTRPCPPVSASSS